MKYLTATTSGEEAGREGAPGRRDSSHHHNKRHSRSVNSDTDSKGGGVGGGGDPNNPFVSGVNSFGFGAMAISPITLLHEWLAHKSPFISSEKLFFIFYIYNSHNA